MVGGVQQGFIAEAIKARHQPAFSTIERQANGLGGHPLFL
jgi:hypothetical protein